MDKVTFYSFVILAMVLALPVISHVLRGQPGMLKYTNYIILGVYLLANLYLTLLSRPLGSVPENRLTPLWSYIGAVNDPELREEVILNILLYIPFGYLMHYAFPRMKRRVIIVCGFLLSAATECTQLIGRLGVCEVDDVISNTLGTVIGVLLYAGYKRLVREAGGKE